MINRPARRKIVAAHSGIGMNESNAALGPVAQSDSGPERV